MHSSIITCIDLIKSLNAECCPGGKHGINFKVVSTFIVTEALFKDLLRFKLLSLTRDD